MFVPPPEALPQKRSSSSSLLLNFPLSRGTMRRFGGAINTYKVIWR
jgi:hypothetical protein